MLVNRLMSRPTVSVVVPFLGDREEAEIVLGWLRGLRTAAGDQLLIADNSPEPVVGALAAPEVTVVGAADRRSASHARNAGAAAASGEWLLFLDADCVPPPDLLDAYFATPVSERCAVVAGEIVGAPDQGAALARWARSRRGNWAEHHQTWGPHPAAVTANMLIRRAAFEQLGGFRLGGGGDVDFSWRAQENGWELLYRPEVVVAHRDRESFRELADQAIAYGGHQRHLRSLYGPSVPRPAVARPLARAAGGTVIAALRGRGEEARLKLVDGAWTTLVGLGWLTRGARARKGD